MEPLASNQLDSSTEVARFRRRSSAPKAVNPLQERSDLMKQPASSQEDPTKSTTVRIKPGPSPSPTNSRTSATAASRYHNRFLHATNALPLWCRGPLRVCISVASFEIMIFLAMICSLYSFGLYSRYSFGDDPLPCPSHEPRLQLDAIDDILGRLSEHTGYSCTYYSTQIQRPRKYFAVPED